MNEIINELFEQALKEFNAENKYATIIVPNPLQEKFAKLIVRECANFAYDYTSNEENVADFHDVGWDCLPGQLRSELKKHFGVKE